MPSAPSGPSDALGGDVAPWELDLAHEVVARFLATRPKPKGGEPTAEDLEQECLAHWITQRHRYRPAAGASPQTFMRRVLEHLLLDLERQARAKKRRGQGPPLSLNQPVDEGANRELGDLLPDVDAEGDPETAAERQELRERLRVALESLSDRERRLVLYRAAGKSMTEVSRLLPVHRDTLYRDLERIRQVFRDQGLEGYLQ